MLGHNPLADPLFWPTLRLVAVLFGFGFGLVLFFARHDLKAGLKGELGQRFFSWLVIAPIFLLAVFTGGILAAGVLFVFAYRALQEYILILGVARPYARYIYALIPVTFLTAFYTPTLYFMLPAASILLLSLVPTLSRHVDELYLQMSFAGRGYLYLVWTTAHVILLWQLAGPGLVVLVGIGAALSDVMQYTVGKLIGRHLIAPEVSPRKAWEGLLGDCLGAGAAVLLFRFGLPPEFAWPQQAALVVLIGIGAAWGDLVSSLVKRAAGAKDWGQLLPGHGGLLDRANSLVIVIPLVYYFTQLLLQTSRP